jgi:AcrR family transcriptional regulator
MKIYLLQKRIILNSSITKSKKTDEIRKSGAQKKAKSKGTKKQTLEKILTAARHVFSNYPYHSATIRMIGKLAEIEHPLISYYFPNKADLFISVLTEATQKQSEAESKWLDEVKAMATARGLSVYFDHQLDYFQRYPETFSIIALNVVQSEDSEPIPGYHLIQDAINASVRSFMEKVPMNAPEYEVEMFCRALSIHLINFLGAAKFHAPVMNMDPNSIQYLNWVKDTALYVFLPRLKMMVKRAD